jgi:hypothetical protein
MMPGDEIAFYRYLFWQRIHGKRMVNGAVAYNKPAWALYEKINDLSLPESVKVLRKAGVTYVVVHNDFYAEGRIPYLIKRYFPPDVSKEVYNGGKPPQNPLLNQPFQRFGGDVVYRLESV